LASDNKKAISDNEKLLFYQVATGDEQAFAILFDVFMPRLYPFIIKFTRSEIAAQEIIQETFIRVWLNRDKLSEIDNPGGWLYKVASNECYGYARKRALNNKLFNALTPETDPATVTQEALELKELKALIHEAVNKLPAQRKKIYLMSRNQGQRIPEIATELGLSPNTVKNALVSSLKFIREYLAKNEIILLILMLMN
jgi:RNA polymerase sigma-70 factor (ECF subfamily)